MQHVYDTKLVICVERLQLISLHINEAQGPFMECYWPQWHAMQAAASHTLYRLIEEIALLPIAPLR